MTEATTENTTPAAAPAEPKWVPEVRNGQAERRPGSRGRQAWDICDAISARKGVAASAAEVVAEGTAIGMNPGQLRAAYAKWRKFHGLQGVRIDNPEKAAEKQAKADAKAAEAEAKKAEKAAAAEAKKAEKAAAAEAKAAEKAAKAEAKAAEKAAAAQAKAEAAAQAEQTPPEQPE